MLRINISKPATKFLQKLIPKHQQQIAIKIQQLRGDSQPPDAKRLKGSELCRVTVGEYRIIYTVVSDTLYILLVGRRNDDDIYRQLRNQG